MIHLLLYDQCALTYLLFLFMLRFIHKSHPRHLSGNSIRLALVHFSSVVITDLYSNHSLSLFLAHSALAEPLSESVLCQSLSPLMRFTLGTRSREEQTMALSRQLGHKMVVSRVVAVTGGGTAPPL